MMEKKLWKFGQENQKSLVLDQLHSFRMTLFIVADLTNVKLGLPEQHNIIYSK